MIDVKQLLYSVCDNELVFEDDCELIESEILDSLAIIDLFSKLEDMGIDIQLTRIDRNRLKTPKSIRQLLSEYCEAE